MTSCRVTMIYCVFSIINFSSSSNCICTTCSVVTTSCSCITSCVVITSIVVISSCVVISSIMVIFCIMVSSFVMISFLIIFFWKIAGDVLSLVIAFKIVFVHVHFKKVFRQIVLLKHVFVAVIVFLAAVVEVVFGLPPGDDSAEATIVVVLGYCFKGEELIRPVIETPPVRAVDHPPQLHDVP